MLHLAAVLVNIISNVCPAGEQVLKKRDCTAGTTCCMLVWVVWVVLASELQCHVNHMGGAGM